ncbi:MAG TPA: AAA family ATPase [Steroidobacter sp.]
MRILLLGELSLIHDGRTAELPASKKTRALLGYLIAIGRPQSRERLCELFWSEGTDDPRGALRWSLTKLRPSLNESGALRLIGDRNHVAFEACGADLDIVTVRRLMGSDVTAAPLDALKTSAAALCSGEFLSGLDLPNCYQYQAWCLAEREGLNALRLSLLSTLVERLRDQPREALLHALALVAADPLSIPGHCAVIRTLHCLGRHNDAHEHCEQASRVIEKDIGISARKELQDAARALQGNVSSRAHTMMPTPASVKTSSDGPFDTVRSAPVWIGRSGERAVVEKLVEKLRHREACPVLHVTGEPGIGKSHLLDQLRRRVAQIGGRTYCARAFEAELARPYGIWSDICAAVTPRSDATVSSGLRGPLIPGLAAAAERSTDKARLFAKFSEALTQLAADRPMLIVLDDIQWIDEGSAALFHYMARTCRVSGGMLLACAARTGELDDNRAVANALASLRREGKLVDTPLAPLTREETAELIRAVDSTLDPERVFDESSGNPLFVLELARSETTDSQGTLNAVIARELTRLTPEGRELLTWAAALGRSFDDEILAELASRSPSEVLASLHELERRSLLHSTAHNDYDFKHDVVRRAAYHSISLPRRKLLHARIARHLSPLAETDDNLASIVAHHAALSSQHLMAARACVLAGDRCLRLFANPGANTFAVRGLWHLDQYPAGPEAAAQRIALHRIQVLAAAVPSMRPLPFVADKLTRAIDAAEAFGLQQAVMTGHYVLSVVHQMGGRNELAQQSTLRAVRAGRGVDNRAYIHQLANTARCLLELEAEVPRARALLYEAETLAEPLGLGLCEVEWGRGLMQRWDGEIDLAEQSISRALELARGAADRWREYKCLTWLATLELERGRLEAAHAHCAEMLQVAWRLGESEVPLAMALDALAWFTSGQERDDQKLASALQQLREIDDKSHLAYALNAAAALCLGMKRVDAARSYAKEALHVAEAMHRTNDRVIAHAMLMRLSQNGPDTDACTNRADDSLEDTTIDLNALSCRARAALQEALQECDARQFQFQR